MTQPAVTVAILAYNHERFIRQAIESVLSQRTSFPIEILVANDCSTDNTAAEVQRLCAENPGRLQIVPRPSNLGLSRNLQDCRERAQGRYLAILEGDDFWIDPLKLQKQHDLLEANADWSMCFGACRVISDDRKVPARIVPDPFPSDPLVLEDFLKEARIQTMSVSMFRQGVVRRTPDWHRSVCIGDWALSILHAHSGPVGFVPEVLTAYRVHGSGLWSGLDSFRRWMEILTLFEHLEQHFAPVDAQVASRLRSAREGFVSQFSDRVKDLEKVERRYQLLGLDRVAAAYRWLAQRSG